MKKQSLPNDEYLTSADLAARWKLHPGTPANWRNREKPFGPRFRKIGRAIRYPLKAVIEWELKHWG